MILVDAYLISGAYELRPQDAALSISSWISSLAPMPQQPTSPRQVRSCR